MESVLRTPVVDLKAAVLVEESEAVSAEGVEQVQAGPAAVRQRRALQVEGRHSCQLRTTRYRVRPFALENGSSNQTVTLQCSGL